MCIFNPGGKDIINRPEGEFPLPRQQTKHLYLDASSKTMSAEQSQKTTNSVTFDSTAKEHVDFTHTFDQRTELTGYFAVKLWIEALEATDVDLFVFWDKVDVSGRNIEHLNVDPGFLQDDPEAERAKVHAPDLKMHHIFWSGGGYGRLRASHRKLSPASTPHNPQYTHQREDLQPLGGAGDVVAVEIEMRPYGIIFERGERIRLQVAGYDSMGDLPWLPTTSTINKGKVAIHMGGEYDSHFVLPLVAEG